MRYKDAEWGIHNNPDGTVPNCDARLSVLMDIRDELKKLNNLLGCQNFLEVPQLLREIKRNTTKPRKKKS